MTSPYSPDFSLVSYADLKGMIVGKLILTDYSEFKEGSCVLEATKLPSKYSAVKFNTFCSFGCDGDFLFTDLPPGEYKLYITCIYKCQTPVYYDNYTEKDYYEIITYEHLWTQSVVLVKNQELKVIFQQGQGTVYTQKVETIFL